jgi:hypothetical protein
VFDNENAPTVANMIVAAATASILDILSVLMNITGGNIIVFQQQSEK